MAFADKLLFFFSGGIQNRIADLSLGGEPSQFLISDGQNNIFDDSTLDVRGDDETDYRCLYLFNKNTSALEDMVVWLESQTEGGSERRIGNTNRQ